MLKTLIETVKSIAVSSGFAQLDIPTLIMMGTACFLLYLAIVKKFEPLLLLPIAFGMLIANIPMAGLAHTLTKD